MAIVVSYRLVMRPRGKTLACPCCAREVVVLLDDGRRRACLSCVVKTTLSANVEIA